MQRYNNIREKERYDIIIVVNDLFSHGFNALSTCRSELDQFIGAGNIKV